MKKRSSTGTKGPMINNYMMVTITLNIFIEWPMEEKEKNTILSMEDGTRIIEGDENLLNHATTYYKNLFGPEIGNAFPLDPSLWNDEESE